MLWLAKPRIAGRRLGVSVRAGITMVVFYGALVLMFMLLVPPVARQARHLNDVDYTKLKKSLDVPLNRMSQRMVQWGLMDNPTPPPVTVTQPVPTKKKGRKTPAHHIPTDSLSHSVVLDVDSVLSAQGDSFTKTNIVLNVNLSSQHQFSTQTSQAPVHTGTPLERLQKQLFAAFSPSKLTNVLSDIVGMLGHLILAFAAITFITFFMLCDKRLFERIILAFVPERNEQRTSKVLEHVQDMLPRYFEGLLLETLGVMLCLWLGLTLLGVPNALLISVFGALLNVVPYLGPVIGAVFGMFIVLCSMLDADFYALTVYKLGWVLVVFLVVHWIDSFLLQPIIFSKRVQAHPLEIFAVIIIGAKLAGIPGMIVAVPVYTTLRVIAAEFLGEFKVVRQLTQHLNNEEGL